MSEKHQRLKDLHIDRADLETTRSGGGYALIVIAALLVVAGAIGIWWYAKNRGTTVHTAAVRSAGGGRTTATVLDASGYVTARRQAVVSSKVTGKIVEVHVEEGLKVREGQVLARLDDATASRQLALAEAQLAASRRALDETEVRLAEAQRNLRRAKSLVAGNVASQSDLDAVQAEVDALQARLELQREEVAVSERTAALRQQEVDDLEIRAPFAGVVVTKDAQPGEMISPVSAGGGFTRTGICTLVDMGSLEIEVDVNEAYINRVRPEQKVEAVLDAYPDWRIPATVITPVPTADRQKATVKVRIGFDTTDPRILPDMGIKVSFLEDAPPAAPETPAAPAWTVPAAAVRRDGDADVVFVVRDGKLARRVVRVLRHQGEEAVLAEGVDTGERVVVDPAEGLREGQSVHEE